MHKFAFTKWLLLLVIVVLSAAMKGTADEVRPQYNLQLTVDYAQRSYRGTAEIQVPVGAGETWNNIAFHLYANLLGAAEQGKSGDFLTIDGVTWKEQPLTFSQNGGVLEVTLPADKSTFSKSTFVALQLSWHGRVPEVATPANALDDMMPKGGLFAHMSAADEGYRNYGLYCFRNGILSLGSYWYPVLAVRANGQWQTAVPTGPGDLPVTAAADYKARVQVNNAPGNISIIATQAAATGNALESAIAGARDFPIIIGEDFSELSQTIKIGERSVQVSSWARRSNAAKSAQALEVAAQALEIFSRRFGAYPWDHFTVVQGSLSGGAGGAEFSGLGIMAQALYADLDRELEKQLGALGLGAGSVGLMAQQQFNALKSLFETSVAHETAHQWWAMGVGSDVRQEPWLDESLTNYCAMLYYKDRYGEARYAEMVQVNLKQPYQMTRFLGLPDAQVDGAVNQFQGDLQYGSIIYGKGALFYEALHLLVGDAAFNAALQKYFLQYQGKMATEQDLLQLFLTTNADKSDAIKSLYQHWIKEQHGDADIGVLSLSDLIGGIN